MAAIRSILLSSILIWMYSINVSCESGKTPAINKTEYYYCKGECNVVRINCSCKESCLEDFSCCSDYLKTCQGKTSWVEDKCTPEKDFICPGLRGFNGTLPVIILSIDGFRDDYLFRNKSPNLWKLASCGVHSPYVRSVYPTSTFTNHQSIATGLYAESHGIVSQQFYDHKLEKEFLAKDSKIANSPSWWGGQPIWVTASNQGLKSAVYDWPGSHVNQTRYPDRYNKNYKQSTPYEERIYQVLYWLNLPPEQRPDFYAMYMEWVDKKGHASGPDSPDVINETTKADDAIGTLMDGLKLRKLENCVNLIVLADHGMAKRSCDNVTVIDKYGVDMSEVYFHGKSAGRIGKSVDKSKWNLFKPAEIRNKLKCKQAQTHLQVFLKQEDLPKRLHYANNDRIDDVILVMNEGWLADKVDGHINCTGGAHGWDNEFKEMNAVFAAHGPAFKRGYNTSEPFENIEIYNLICDLLGLNPVPNNGTEGSLNHLLQKPKPIDFDKSYATSSDCPYPTGSDIVTDHLGCEVCGGEDTANIIKEIIKNGSNMARTIFVANEYQRMNMLAGAPKIFPVVRDTMVDFCNLTQREYVTVYDRLKKMPYYVSYFLDCKRRSDDQQCRRPDIRLNKNHSPTCQDYASAEDRNVAGIYLYPPSFSTQYGSDASILSNLIPVYKPFVPVWEQFNEKLNNWADKYHGISVVTGPIFDFNFDGRADSKEIIEMNADYLRQGDKTSSPLPTHVFAIITKCNESSSSYSQMRDCWILPDKIDVLSFVIPNYNETPCTNDESADKWVPRTLKEHVARVRDIELLTAMSFFPDWTTDSKATEIIKLNGLRKKLHLPEFESSWMKDFVRSLDEGNSTPKPEISKRMLFLCTLLMIFAKTH